jgi:hypothetical protein
MNLGILTMKKTNFTKKDLTNLYWILVQYVEDCDPKADRKVDLLFRKIETMWNEAK